MKNEERNPRSRKKKKEKAENGKRERIKKKGTERTGLIVKGKFFVGGGDGTKKRVTTYKTIS